MKATTNMAETVNTLKYPEHQAEWLEAMGVLRWQATAAFEQVDAGEVVRVVEVSDAQANDAQAVAPMDSPVVVAVEWSAALLNADYAVFGAAALTAQEAYLLAGMMLSIGAKRTVYVYATDDALESMLATGLAALPTLSVCAVDAAQWRALSDLPETMVRLALGRGVYDAPWSVPTLAELIDEPLKKREAWQVLKKIKINKT